MSTIQVTIVGNLTADPELRYTATGTPVAMFTVASDERRRGEDGQWQDGPVSFVRVLAWRDLGEHLSESLARGDRVVVAGVLRQRSYEADGAKRTVWEVTANEIGASLRYATVKVTKTRRDSVPVPDDPWAEADVPSPAPPPSRPPF